MTTTSHIRENGTIDRAAFEAHRASIEASARKIDTSRTEDVRATDLRVGDVVTGIDGVVFPFPFTVSRVQHAGPVTFVFYAHGGMSPSVLPHHVVHRVA